MPPLQLLSSPTSIATTTSEYVDSGDVSPVIETEEIRPSSLSFIPSQCTPLNPEAESFEPGYNMREMNTDILNNTPIRPQLVSGQRCVTCHSQISLQCVHSEDGEDHLFCPICDGFPIARPPRPPSDISRDLSVDTNSVDFGQPGASSSDVSSVYVTPSRPRRTDSDIIGNFLTTSCSGTFANSDWKCAYHMVRGTKRFGLIIDPGAADGLIGSDTLREFLEHAKIRAEFRGTDRQFLGINGEPSPGLAKTRYQLGLPGLDVKYEADIIGGTGSYCPGLLPNSNMVRNKCGLLCGYFSNDDGLFIVRTHKGTFGYRALLTDTKHYLLPCDDFSKASDKDIQTCTLLARSEMTLLDEQFKHMHQDRTDVVLHQDEAAAGREESLVDFRGMLKSWGGGKYEKDIFPKDMPETEKRRLKSYYKNVAEQFYTNTGLKVVTPESFRKFMDAHKGCDIVWDLQGLCSGSSILSYEDARKKMLIGFTVDYRYG